MPSIRRIAKLRVDEKRLRTRAKELGPVLGEINLNPSLRLRSFRARHPMAAYGLTRWPAA